MIFGPDPIKNKAPKELGRPWSNVIFEPDPIKNKALRELGPSSNVIFEADPINRQGTERTGAIFEQCDF